MSRKIKKKNIETQLHMRGNAEIEKWAEAALNIPDPEESQENDPEDTPTFKELLELREQKIEESKGL